MLKDPSALDDLGVEYNNVPPIEPFRLGPPVGSAAGNGPNDAGTKLDENGNPLPVDVTKQRQSYKDRIDEVLDYVRHMIFREMYICIMTITFNTG